MLEDLLKSLRDKDTIVRYSAAKGVARVSERLPADFADQVLEQVLQLFSIHSIAVASLYDMPSVAEGTWHGACLACAEMARRGLIPDERLGELVGWLNKVSAACFFFFDSIAVLSTCLARLCISISARAHTQSDRTYGMQHPMYSGRSQERKA